MIFKRKNRYILIEASSPIDLSDRRIFEAAATKLKTYLGEQVFIESNPQIISKLDEKNFIMKVTRGTEKQIFLALSFLKGINDKEIGFYTIKTSGTVRTIKEYFASYRRQKS